MNLFFDIETIPADKKLRATILELERKKIAKREGTEDLNSKTKKSDETIYRMTALSGDFGQILCIGYAVDDKPAQVITGNEEEILKKWWNIAERASRYIGHNIMDFDLPFIFKRSIVHKIKPSAENMHLSFARYRNRPIYDTMREWDKWSMRTAASLDKLAKVLDLPSSKDGGIDGSQVYDAHLEGRDKEIYDYCIRDVELTRKVYRRMNFQD